MNKGILRHSIYKTLGYFNLSIRQIRPREFVKYCKEYFGNKYIIGCEVGVQFGMNSKDLFDNLNIKRLYLVDPYEDYLDSYNGVRVQKTGISNTREKAVTRLYEYGKKAVFINHYSNEGYKYIFDELDFVYIDANHSYKNVKEDLELYWNMIKVGGILGGHDFGIYDVGRAVVEFANEKGLDVITRFKDHEFIMVKK